MHGGDCIYIPADSIHHIRSYGRAVGISYHWQPITLLNTDEFEDCSTKNELKDHTYMTVDDLQLKYKTNIRGMRYIDLKYYHDDDFWIDFSDQEQNPVGLGGFWREQ